MPTGTELFELFLVGVTIGMVYVLLAAGLSIIFGVMDVLNISHGELLALGAYFTFALTSRFDSGFWIALIVVPLVVGVLGMGIERLTIRRIYGEGHLAHVLLTFGLLLIIYDAKQIVWGSGNLLVSAPPALSGPITIFGFSNSLYNYFMMVAAAALALLTWVVLRYTRFGLVVRAGSEDRRMVRNLGIDIDSYYTLVFGFGAALAAFGGVVLGAYQNVSPGMGNAVIIPAFVIVVLGGLGSFRGAVVGGLIVGVIQSYVSVYLPALQGTIIFLLMAGVLLVRPRGLFGKPQGKTGGGTSETSEFVSSLGGGVLTQSHRRLLGWSVLGAFALIPVFQGTFYTAFVLSMATSVLIWALFAMSLDIVLGYTGLISLGHAMFFGLGAYSVMYVLTEWTASAIVAIAAALGVCAIVAVVVGRLAIRVSGVYFVMITLAFAQVVWQGIQQLNFLGGTNGMFGSPNPLYGIAGFGLVFQEVAVGIEPLTFADDQLFFYLLLAVVVAMFLLARRVMNSPFGTVLQAIRESEQRARVLGYDVQKFKRQAFVFSGILGGLAGGMLGLYANYAAPAMLHWINSGDVIVMAVLGGTGTLYGPMIGAGIFTVFEEQLSSLIPWWRLLLGVFFVVVVLFVPNGIIALPTRIRELFEAEPEVSGPEDERRERT